MTILKQMLTKIKIWGRVNQISYMELLCKILRSKNLKIIYNCQKINYLKKMIKWGLKNPILIQILRSAKNLYMLKT